MRARTLALLLAAGIANAQQQAQPATVISLVQVRRIFVGPLTGSEGAQALRDLIISSIDGTKLFILTDNVERADAVLKGAGDDQAFVDTLDTSSGANTRGSGGKYGSGSGSSKIGGGYLGIGGSDNESHHIRERKHEAYATVRLCNRDGDVLWSTTQESLGAKFRGASADVASKIARQLTLDFERAQSTVEAKR